MTLCPLKLNHVNSKTLLELPYCLLDLTNPVIHRTIHFL